MSVGNSAEPTVSPELPLNSTPTTSGADNASETNPPIFEPQNPLEGALLEQMNLIQQSARECMERATQNGASSEVRLQEMQLLQKFSKLLSDQMQLLFKLRHQALNYKVALDADNSPFAKFR